MTKQEEIREWLGRTLDDKGFQGASIAEQRDLILQYLYSQGVVIRVDKELPKITQIEAYNGDLSLNQLYVNACEDRGHEMLKAGYVATEPLIKEVTNGT